MAVTIPTMAPARLAISASGVRKSASPESAADGQQLCSTSTGAPLVEPEALTSIHANEASAVATGQGVIVGNVDANSLAGNPNLIRPDGQHVVIDAPTPNENVFSVNVFCIQGMDTAKIPVRHVDGKSRSVV